MGEHTGNLEIALVLGTVAAITLVVLVCTRPSRIEVAFTRVFGRESPVYRVLGVCVLLLLVAGALYARHEFHLSQQPRPV